MNYLLVSSFFCHLASNAFYPEKRILEGAIQTYTDFYCAQQLAASVKEESQDNFNLYSLITEKSSALIRKKISNLPIAINSNSSNSTTASSASSSSSTNNSTNNEVKSTEIMSEREKQTRARIHNLILYSIFFDILDVMGFDFYQCSQNIITDTKIHLKQMYSSREESILNKVKQSCLTIPQIIAKHLWIETFHKEDSKYFKNNKTAKLSLFFRFMALACTITAYTYG